MLSTALVLAVYLVYVNTIQQQEKLERDVSLSLRQMMTSTQGTIEYLLRKDGLNQLQDEITTLGANQDLKYAVLVNENDEIVASIRIADRGEMFYERIVSAFMTDQAQIEKAIASSRNTLRGSVWIKPDGSGIYSTFPVLINDKGSVIAHKNIGFMFSYVDISRQKSEILNDLIWVAATVSGPIFLFAILTSWLLIRVVTRRIENLVNATHDLSEGKYTSRQDFSGKDEISALYRSFDEMAQKISQSQLDLQKKERHLRLILDSASEGIFGVDLDGVCTFANPACITMLGYDSEDELTGYIIHQKIHHTKSDGTHYPKEQCQVRVATLNGEVGHSLDEVHWRKDGSNFPVEWWSHPIIKDGEISGAVVTFIDISDRQKSEKALLEAHITLEQRVKERTEELESANNAKSKFLSRISHELRTPLNAIIGFSDLIARSQSHDDKTQHQVSRIHSAGKHLLTLIEEILDLSRIDTGDIQINTQAVELDALIKEVISIVEYDADHRGIIMSISVFSNLKVTADPVRLREVLLNLLSNAVKYNKDNGKVNVSSMIHNDMVRITVTDTGYGLTELQISQLFQPFSRLGAEYTGVQGTGIGMTISKRLTELMHGSIEVSSVPDKGTSFHINLPCA